MPKYSFEAIAKGGDRVHGDVEADDALSAVHVLQSRQGYRVVSVRTMEEVDAELQRRQDAVSDAEAQLASELAASEPQEIAHETQVNTPDAVLATQDASPAPKAHWWTRLFSRSKKPVEATVQSDEAAEAPVATDLAESVMTAEAEPMKQDPEPEPEPETEKDVKYVTSRHLSHGKKHHHALSLEAEAKAPEATPVVENAQVEDAATAKTDTPVVHGEEPQLSAWDRFISSMFPKHAAKIAAARAAQASARTAEIAAEAAKQTAEVVKNLSERAQEVADRPAVYSRLFGANIVTKRGRAAFEAYRQKKELKRHAKQHTGMGSSGVPGDTGDQGDEEGQGQDVSSDLSSVDLLRGVRRSATLRHTASEDLTDEMKREGGKIDFDLERIDIKAPGLLGWIRYQIAVIRRKSEIRRRAKAKAKEEKIKAENDAKKAAADLVRQKAQVKAAKKAKEAKEKAEKAKQKTTTVVIGDGKKGPKLTLWQQILALFAPKKKSADGGVSRRLSFQMSEADQQREIEKARLLIQGFVPTGNPFVDAYGKLNDFLISHQKVKLKELVQFYNLLAVMINSGIPLVKSLHQLVDQQKNPRFKRVLFQAVYEVENGKSLSRAMREFPDIFNDAHLGMIEAGEASGQLGTVMKRIAEEAEKSHKMLSKVKGALIYPMVIMTILAIVMIVVMVMVVPKMVEVFANAGASLPLPTRVLIAISDFIIGKWYILVIIVSGLFIGTTTYIKTEEGKYYFDYVKLKLPIFGSLFMKVSLARFTSSLSTLSSSGLSIIKALKINADSVGNEIFRQEILATAESVKRGVSIAKDLQGNKLFPAMVVDMIAVGEETAQVANVSQKISEFYEAEVEDMVKNMQSLMEPIIIVVVGVMVGGLVAAIMLPIMNLSDVATKG